MILSTHGFVASSIGQIDADALAFFARVDAATSTTDFLTTTEKTAINNLVISLKANGIWSKIKAAYPMVGGGTGTTAQRTAACSQNLKSSSFTGTFTATGWTFASTGATPNGTSAYFDTNLQISTNLTETNTTLSIYSRTNSTKDAWDIGGRNFGFSSPMGILSNYSGTTYAAWSDYSIQTTGVLTAAFFILTKNSSTVKLFRNNSNIISGTKTLTSLPTTNILIAGTQQATSGVYGDFSNRQYAFASIGDGLTDTEASNFYTAVQAFQTTLKRQVS